MNIVYVVYREDNTLVFDSQVLEYLKLLSGDYNVTLVSFRNHENMFKKKTVEHKISGFVKDYITLPTLPPLAKTQLDIDSIRLKLKLEKRFNKDTQLLILCRGDLATYIASRAFSKDKNKIILFDNRGLPIEEFNFREKNTLLYNLTKKVRKKAILYSKDNCDIYSFVTNELRKYVLKEYKYIDNKKYFIIPTLNSNTSIDNNKLNEIKNDINYNSNNFYVIYIGSVAAWQNSHKIIEVFSTIKQQIDNAKLLILTNGKITIPDTVEKNIMDSIIIKSVKHDLVKYYLEISNLGLVLRDNNIVNKVAAPTKIAEYLSNSLPILYSGKIGVIEDLKKLNESYGLINLENNDWIDKVKSFYSSEQTSEIKKMYEPYFNMERNQKNLIDEIKKDFKLS
ncbi:hypothetical protein H7S55_00290 [Priestia aryabhattai]|uniref:hypothetical protein n=1 Tax=Priestia aryabhattai TaxID=412384 RepID=UPI001C8D0866|nr:hypothetical protein [Priestia aryabhattai]MBX9998580.1 hypothetical protein [Priestia aryabhattai]